MTVKWGQGCWVSGTIPKIFIHTEPDYVQFGFYNGSALKDPNKLLVGSGKYVRHIKVRALKDINVPVFTNLIIQAIKSGGQSWATEKVRSKSGSNRARAREE